MNTGTVDDDHASIRRRSPKWKRLTLLALLVGLVGGGTALAYWSGTGNGSGTATVGTGGTVTIHATVPDGIAPGATEPVTFTAANPSTAPIRIRTVHLSYVAVDLGHPACDQRDFSMADVTEDHSAPAGATADALPTGGTLVYENTASNQDACKGAVIYLNLTSL